MSSAACGCGRKEKTMLSLEDLARTLVQKTESGSLRWIQEDKGAYSTTLDDTTVLVSARDPSGHLIDDIDLWPSADLSFLVIGRMGQALQKIILTPDSSGYDEMRRLYRLARQRSRVLHPNLEDLIRTLEKLP